MAILISAAALVLSIVALLSSTLNRRQQCQVAISQKRTDVLVAMHDIELAMEPAIRDVKMLVETADPASPRLQPTLDRMIALVDRVQVMRNQFTEGISQEESSHKVLLALETLMAELYQQIKSARALKGDVERMISELNTRRESAKTREPQATITRIFPTAATSRVRELRVEVVNTGYCPAHIRTVTMHDKSEKQPITFATDKSGALSPGENRFYGRELATLAGFLEVPPDDLTISVRSNLNVLDEKSGDEVRRALEEGISAGT